MQLGLYSPTLFHSPQPYTCSPILNVTPLTSKDLLKDLNFNLVVVTSSATISRIWLLKSETLIQVKNK